MHLTKRSSFTEKNSNKMLIKSKQSTQKLKNLKGNVLRLSFKTIALKKLCKRKKVEAVNPRKYLLLSKKWLIKRQRSKDLQE